jgi:hypothetical protein
MEINMAASRRITTADQLKKNLLQLSIRFACGQLREGLKQVFPRAL